MELMFNSLYKNVKDRIPMLPVAGTEGFYRLVRWIQIDDHSPNLPQLLHSGDLVITADCDYLASDTDRFVGYIRRLAELEASGLILHPGIQCTGGLPRIDRKVIDYCDEIQFPLLIIQGDFHISDITREMCSMLFEFDHNYDVINDILCGLLYEPHISSRSAEHLTRFGFPMDSDYIMLAYRDDAGELFRNADDRNYKYLNRFFFTLREKFFYFREAGYGVILIQNSNEREVAAHAGDIVRSLVEIHGNDSIRCGVGTRVQSVANIRQSFQNARAALNYARLKKKDCMTFEELGFYKMLFSSGDQDILKEYTRCLEPLLDYDRQHGSDLVQTLSAYLRFGKSIQRVASELNCHRNTINYRMQKIEKLLYLDVDEYENAFILELAFRVLEYLQQLKLEDLHHED